ncbi:MAG: response regulator [Candidatus Omnitrophica bacterium]|nr:response regulator [Candidatus Omnitrophota bacterium]
MAKKKILVIDDDLNLSSALKVRLSSEGFQVECAGDGKDGIEMAQRNNPDLIILDLMLPKLPGEEICRIIRKDEKLKEIPIIVLTAKNEEVDRIIAKVIGATYVMTKPFETKELCGKIAEVLRD